jgi:dolichol kinase
LVGIFAAFWPFFMSFRQIMLMAFVFVGGVLAARSIPLLSRVFTIFGLIHLTGRKTLGELFFSLGIGLAAVLTDSKWVFAAAILHVGLADGLAAVLGIRYGGQHQYKVFGQVKSVAGNITFFIISLVITGTVIFLQPDSFKDIALPLLIGLPVLATMVETLAPFGSDNVFLALLVVWALGL